MPPVFPSLAAETAAISSAPQIERRNGRAQSIEQREDIYRFRSDLVSLSSNTLSFLVSGVNEQHWAEQAKAAGQ
jgi:hypothetical protein